MTRRCESAIAECGSAEQSAVEGDRECGQDRSQLQQGGLQSQSNPLTGPAGADCSNRKTDRNEFDADHLTSDVNVFSWIKRVGQTRKLPLFFAINRC